MKDANIKRDQWDWTNPDHWNDGTITVTSTADGLRIEVEEEKAMDSYNRTFCCGVTIPTDVAAQLFNFLRKVLP